LFGGRSSLPSPIDPHNNASNQKHCAKHGTDQIEVVAGTVGQSPPHDRKQLELFGDMGEDSQPPLPAAPVGRGMSRRDGDGVLRNGCFASGCNKVLAA
jgi:hypothetical protein